MKRTAEQPKLTFEIYRRRADEYIGRAMGFHRNKLAAFVILMFFSILIFAAVSGIFQTPMD